MDQADLVRLRHMRDAAEESLRFAQGKSRADLDRDRMLVLAVLKDLEIIGEAAGKVSMAARQQHQSVPWDDIIGMRNRLIHGYFDVTSISSGKRSRMTSRRFSPNSNASSGVQPSTETLAQ